jgi:hypothetical protein
VGFENGFLLIGWFEGAGLDSQPFAVPLQCHAETLHGLQTIA